MGHCSLLPKKRELLGVQCGSLTNLKCQFKKEQEEFFFFFWQSPSKAFWTITLLRKFILGWDNPFYHNGRTWRAKGTCRRLVDSTVYSVLPQTSHSFPWYFFTCTYTVPGGEASYREEERHIHSRKIETRGGGRHPTTTFAVNSHTVHVLLPYTVRPVHVLFFTLWRRCQYTTHKMNWMNMFN